jgi:predicted esterase
LKANFFIYSFIITLIVLACSTLQKNTSFKASSNKSLSKKEAVQIANVLFKEFQDSLINNLEKQWENKVLEIGELKMSFYYQTFGEKPIEGRSLYISMHGGGGTTAEINDQQYENQKHLYDGTMDTLEGIYLAPRAPTNTWNLWHQSHIDQFFELLIFLMIEKEDVDPNKIYLLGYSAGGDGVFQLATRMTDRFAAASMMAGHPNDAVPFNLSNMPFALHMGSLDSAYQRNQVAENWQTLYKKLSHLNPGSYQHQIVIHEEKGHWMQLEDAIALPWMSQFQRNPLPEKIIWYPINKAEQSMYWLAAPQSSIIPRDSVIVSYNRKNNEIFIEENPFDTLDIFLNDKILDLDKTITLKTKEGIIFRDNLTRTRSVIQSSIASKNDKELIFFSKLRILNNKVAYRN